MYYNDYSGGGFFSTLLYYAVLIAVIAAFWRLFTKAGRAGWKALIPIYDSYVLYDIIFGNGWMMFLMLIPIYNIYFYFKTNIRLAHVYGKSTGFGIGLALLPGIFFLILGFGSSVYLGNGQQPRQGYDGSGFDPWAGAGAGGQTGGYDPGPSSGGWDGSWGGSSGGSSSGGDDSDFINHL